ncbi:MAG: hypothetical protein Q8P02_01555 [Candidatus Micrarchaeota archaeon]|nr:hypothetical protein [Candidatus Micrarchaeota archaeon]
MASWRTTRTNRYVARHRPDVDHADLFNTIQKPPRYRVGQHPNVHVHDFGKGVVSVRDFTPKDTAYRRPEDVFPIMERIAGGRPALVEELLAHFQIFHSDGPRHLLVTAWHAGSRPMREFLADAAISGVQKRRALEVLMRKLARLHANGYLHGHPKVDNAVASAKQVGLLVDPTRLYEPYPGMFDIERENECVQLASGLATHLSRAVTGTKKMELERQLRSIYEKAFNRFIRHLNRRT